MWLLVGLGNPGRFYENHRHNAGALFLEYIREKEGLPPWAEKLGNLVSSAGDFALLKPTSYMNLSGPPVARYASFFKIPPTRLIVVHDELDLPFGEIRLKEGGGAGGHNGLRSLLAHMPAAFWRLRVGIGHPGHRDRVTGYVLSDFSQEERADLEGLWGCAWAALKFFMASGGQLATFGTRLAQEKKERLG